MGLVTLCTHYACRCARAAELAVIADRTGHARFLAEAINVHRQEVECRHWKPTVWATGGSGKSALLLSEFLMDDAAPWIVWGRLAYDDTKPVVMVGLPDADMPTRRSFWTRYAEMVFRYEGAVIVSPTS